MNDPRRGGEFARRAPGLLLLLAAIVSASAFAPRVAAANPAASGCSTSRTDLSPDAEEVDLIRRINGYRTNAGFVPLIVSPPLMASAAWKSVDLGANAYFGHDDIGRSWTQRLRDCGYGDTPNVAENVAAGYADGASTFGVWRAEAAHNAIMLDAGMRAVGVARAYIAGSPYGWYWTADFGAVAPAAPSPVGSPPPTAAPAQAGASLLGVGGTAAVSGTGDCLRVHQAATITAAVVGCLADGTTMVVIAGPIAADGYRWWQLGGLGWAVDRYLAAVPLP